MATQRNEIVTVLTINAEQAAAGAKKYAEALEQVFRSTEKAADGATVYEQTISNSARANARYVSEAEKLYQKLNPQYEAMKSLELQQRKLAEATETVTRQMAAGHQTYDQGRERLEAYRKASTELQKVQLELTTGTITHQQAHLKAQQAITGTAEKSRLAAHEITNLSYQIQDAAVQLAGGQNPFLILMQQGPQATGAVGGVGRALSLLVSPMGLAVTGAAAVAAGFALVGTRAVGIEGNIRALTVTTQAYGTTAQATAEQLRGISKSLYDGGAGYSEADATAKVLASTRGISATMAREFASLGNDMAAGMGKSVDEMVKDLTALETEGYPAIKKLQDAIGFLTADEMNAVRTMAEHGHQTEALSMAMEALHRRFDGLREQSMSPTQKAMHDLGVGWNSFMDAVATSRPVMDTIANVSGAVVRMANAVTSTPKQQVADLEARAAEIRKSIAMRDTAKNSGEKYVNLNLWSLITGTTDGADLEAQLAKIEDELKAARGRVVTELSKNPVRMAGTQAGANSFGNKTDEKALQYVDEQSAAYERLAKAMGGSAAQRALGLAAMKAEDEIRDKKLSGLDAENIRILRRNEAMLQMAASYGDEMRGLTLTTQGNIALGDAYGVSEAAAIRQKAANDAVAATAGNAAVNVAELTRQNVMAVAANTYEGIAKQNMQLDLQNKLLPSVTAATRDGVTARMEAERQMQVEITLAPVLAAAAAAEAEGNSYLAAKLREAAAAYEVKAKKASGQQKSDVLEQAIAQQAKGIEQTRLEISLMGKSATERAHAMALFQAEQQIKAAGINTARALNDEDQRRVDLIRRQAVEQSDLQLELECCEDFPPCSDTPEIDAIFEEAFQ